MDDYSDFMSHEIKRLGIDLEALPTTLKFLKYLVPSVESTISSLQDQVTQINAALDNSKIIDRHLIQQGWFIHDLWSYPASVESLGLVYQACDRCSFS